MAKLILVLKKKQEILGMLVVTTKHTNTHSPHFFKRNLLDINSTKPTADETTY